jgi:hypothetical protein
VPVVQLLTKLKLLFYNDNFFIVTFIQNCVMKYEGFHSVSHSVGTYDPITSRGQEK